MSEKKTYFDHAYDLAYTVYTTNPEGGEATLEEIRAGLMRRVACLMENDDELRAASNCYDPMEEEYSEADYKKWKEDFKWATVIETSQGIPLNARTLPSSQADDLFKKLAVENGASELHVQDILQQHGHYANGDYSVAIVEANFTP
jgi:hypothetical protein